MFVFISVWCHYVWRHRALMVRRPSKSTDLIDLIWFDSLANCLTVIRYFDRPCATVPGTSTSATSLTCNMWTNRLSQHGRQNCIFLSKTLFCWSRLEREHIVCNAENSRPVIFRLFADELRRSQWRLSTRHSADDIKLYGCHRLNDNVLS